MKYIASGEIVLISVRKNCFWKMQSDCADSRNQPPAVESSDPTRAHGQDNYTRGHFKVYETI